VTRPETRFAWNGDVSLAYQLVGSGTRDILYLQGYCSQVDLGWESPHLGAFLRRLAAHGRLILTDRRGWGCSERFSPGDVADIDALTDDILAVLDAAGSDRAAILATYECTIVAALFAAAYPERTSALILVDPFVSYLDTDIRTVLPTIQAPTLVLVDLAGFFEVKPETGRYVASRIPGAQLAEHSSAGGHHLHWYRRAEPIVDEVGRFLARVQEEEASFDRVLATVLFTDIVRSAETASRLGDARWRQLLERHHTSVRALLGRYRGREIDTAGDGFFASFDGPARAARCALALVDAVRPLGVEIRAGLHTGEVETIGGKPGGVAVNVGARIAALAGPSEVLASQTVRDLVAGSGLVFADRGSHELKGVPGEWRLFAVTAA
jgi:class 3 adenylate cyclase